MLPGSCPETQDEIAKAAKKYNMTLHDYKPHPDDGMGFGDYPALPDRSQSERDPHYQWDDPELRRNWGEPMHWDFDIYIRNRVDTSPAAMDWKTMTMTLGGFVGIMLLFFVAGEVFPAYQPVAPKQYPFNNLHLERGGDPDKMPEEEAKNYKI